MSHIAWTDRLATGNSVIDHQHMHLISLVNELNDAAAQQGDEATIRAILLEFVRYCRVHFAAEEELMRSVEFPGLEAHISQHAELAENTRAFASRVPLPDASELRTFTYDWLMQHIVLEDMVMVDYVNAIAAQEDEAVSA